MCQGRQKGQEGLREQSSLNTLLEDTHGAWTPGKTLGHERSGWVDQSWEATATVQGCGSTGCG